MQRNWFTTTALTVALLAATVGSAAAQEKPLEIPVSDGQVIEAAPIRAQIVTVEGLLQKSELEGGYEVDGWMLIGDRALFESLIGQQVWVLGTEDHEPSILMHKRVKVERIERNVAMNRVLPQSITVNGRAATWDQAPFMHKGTLMLPLRAMVEAAGGKIEWRPEDWSAYVLMADRTAYFKVGEPKAEMYLHAARYLAQNFLAMDQQVVLQNGRMFISADALTSVLGMNEEVSLDSTKLNLRFPQYQFDVEEEAPVDLSYELKWESNTLLNITGKTNLPDLQFHVLLDGKVIAQADTTVKEGVYIANVIVEGGRNQTGKLELAIIDPISGNVLATTSTGNINR